MRIESQRASFVGRCGVLHAVVAALTVASWPAYAQVRAAIVAVDLDGDLGAEAAEPLVEALAAGLRPTATSVMTPVEVQAQLDRPITPSDQADPARLTELGRLLEAETLVFADVEQLEQHYAFRVDMMLARDGSHLTTTSLECSACTWDEALATMRRAGRGVASALPGMLSVDVTPADASVVVDDDPLAAGAAISLQPGLHRVEARLDGYGAAAQEVNIVAGALSDVSLALTATTDQPSPPPPRPRHAWVWAWVTAGGALAAAVPGVLWLALDGRCPVGWDDNDGPCPQVYDLWPQGLALTVVSGALLSASIALFIIDARRRRRSSGARVTVVPGVASALVIGRF